MLIGSTGELKQKLITSFHDSALGGHSGENATYKRIKLIFHWHGMKKDTTEYVKQCAVCQINKNEHTPYPGLLQPLKVPEEAWESHFHGFHRGAAKIRRQGCHLSHC